MFCALFLFAPAIAFDLSSMSRQILKQGLHREMLTTFDYVATPSELQQCSLVVRENITKDHYIYYEEVTRDLPGFQSHFDKVMNIEAPTSTSKDETWIWRLPLNEGVNSYITETNSLDGQHKTTVKFRFHYRYQMV